MEKPPISRPSEQRVRVTLVHLEDVVPPASHAHAICATPSGHFSGSFDYWFVAGCSLDAEDSNAEEIKSDMQVLYFYDPHLRKFTEIKPNCFEGVTGLYRASAIYREDAKNGPELIVFGGVKEVGYSFVSTLFRYSILEEKWTEIHKREGHFWPNDIAFHPVLYDESSDRMIVMGGKDEDGGRMRAIIEYDFGLDEVCGDLLWSFASYLPINCW